MPEVFEAGDMGWANDRPIIRMQDGATIDFRWSAVFRREQGTWKAVQIHASAAIPDEQLLARG